MHPKFLAPLLALLASSAFAPLAAEPCRAPGMSGRAAPAQGTTGRGAVGCAPPERLVPYEPAEPGRRAGFVDLGGGTEIRIGGRAQADFGTRR